MMAVVMVLVTELDASYRLGAVMRPAAPAGGAALVKPRSIRKLSFSKGRVAIFPFSLCETKLTDWT